MFSFSFGLLMLFNMTSNITDAFIIRNEFNAEHWKGESISCRIMTMWGLRRQRLIHDYSLVGYILAPNPTIMSHAIKNKKFAHEQAAERLIVKLLLSPSLNGNAWEIEKARLIDKFHQEFGEFTGRRGKFDRSHIWIGLRQLILA